MCVDDRLTRLEHRLRRDLLGVSHVLRCLWRVVSRVIIDGHCALGKFGLAAATVIEFRTIIDIWCIVFGQHLNYGNEHRPSHISRLVIF